MIEDNLWIIVWGSKIIQEVLYSPRETYSKSPIELRAALRTWQIWKFQLAWGKVILIWHSSTNLSAPYCSALLISFDNWLVNLHDQLIIITKITILRNNSKTIHSSGQIILSLISQNIHTDLSMMTNRDIPDCHGNIDCEDRHDDQDYHDDQDLHNDHNVCSSQNTCQGHDPALLGRDPGRRFDRTSPSL